VQLEQLEQLGNKEQLVQLAHKVPLELVMLMIQHILLLPQFFLTLPHIPLGLWALMAGMAWAQH
jgi:hypothetical protein